MKRRVVVTGLGVVTPLGSGVEHVWPRLLAVPAGLALAWLSVSLLVRAWRISEHRHEAG